MRFLHAALHPDGEGPFPTLIALHGHGAHALDLIGLSQTLPGGLLWLCPQAQFTIEQGFHGFTWFHFDRSDPRREEELARVVDELREFIELAIERYPVDPQRLALLGFSQGGMLGYRIALSEPGRFAGFAALSTTLSAETATAVTGGPALSRLPVLLQHGEHDPMITVARARESRQLLEELGVDLEYHEYPMGHQVGVESARHLGAWLTRVLRMDAADGPGASAAGDTPETARETS